jgi:hypothetical protein
MDSDRLDVFFSKLLESNESFGHLWVVVKIVLVLLHGQAAVESGFSINEDILVENLTEKSVIAQRVVLNALQYYGGVLKVPLTTELYNSFKSASRRRNVALEERRSRIEKDKMSNKRKHELDGKLAKIESDKANLLKQISDLESEATEIKKKKTSL